MTTRFGTGFTRSPFFLFASLAAAIFWQSLAPSASAVAGVTATKDDNVPAATRKLAGDTVTYTNKITNSGADVTGVQFQDPDVAHTTLTGTVKVTPIAFDDAYSTVGNTQLTVNAASGLLANDIDPDHLPHVGTVVKVASVTRIGGTVSGSTFNVAADGSFTYLPGLGLTGTETFSYLITDSDAQDSVTTGVVTFTVTGRVWYVVAGGTGDGRSTTPLGSPASASTAARSANVASKNGGSVSFSGAGERVRDRRQPHGDELHVRWIFGCACCGPALSVARHRTTGGLSRSGLQIPNHSRMNTLLRSLADCGARSDPATFLHTCNPITTSRPVATHS